MKLINCNLSDAKLLFKIHRESVNKGHLRSISPIPTFKIWKSWLQYKLFISKSKIFIGKIKNYKFGFTRFDHINKKNYEVSIGILSKHCSCQLCMFPRFNIEQYRINPNKLTYFPDF